MDYLAIGTVVTLLTVEVFMIGRCVTWRNRLLRHLKQTHPSVYEEVSAEYGLREILAGDPRVFGGQLRQTKALLSKQVRIDDEAVTLQRQFRMAIWRASGVAALFVIWAIVGVKFVMG
jgi:hypothetical protein